jgi:hypothetical protein
LVAASFAATAPSSTHPNSVWHPAILTVLPATSLDRNLPGKESVNPGNAIVSHGTVHPVANKAPAARANMSAPYAAPSVTTPNVVMSLPDFLCVNTPFIPDEWENLLNDISPFNKFFSDVPDSLRFGFDMGVHTPPSHTYTHQVITQPFPFLTTSYLIFTKNCHYVAIPVLFLVPSAGGVFGRVADAKSAILESKDIGPAKNWVDDFIFFRFPTTLYPNPTFSYSLTEIYALAKRLGWPWKESKTKPFSLEFTYLGFLWSLSTKTVQIPEPKKLRYLVKLDPWREGQKFSRKDVESVVGTLVHCSLAVPHGRSHLPSLSRFAASFNFSSSPFVRKSPSPSVLADISWWRSQLAADFCGSTLAEPPPVSPLEFWVDASSSWGIGIVFAGEWDAWRFSTGWDMDGRNIGWAEIVAIEIGLLFAIHRGFSDIHFLIKSDNQGVIHAIKGGKSRSPTQNLVLQHITSLLSQHNLWISSLYVPSLDKFSRPAISWPSCCRPPSSSVLYYLTTLPTSLFISHPLAPLFVIGINIIFSQYYDVFYDPVVRWQHQHDSSHYA